MGNRGSTSELELQCCGDAGDDGIGNEGDVVRVRVQSNKKLGEGGFGTVFMAKEVATKKVRSPARLFSKRNSTDSENDTDGRDSSPTPKAINRDSTKGARLFACKQLVCKEDDWIISAETEIKMHRLCGSHQNILPLLASTVINAGHGVREYYLLLPLCSGGSLQDAINAARPGESAFTMKNCVEIFSEVAGAVQALHDTGFVHRDIKPANIMFMPQGRPQLMDLGSCARNPVPITTLKEAAMLADTAAEKSTPTYRAPELFDCTHLIPCKIGAETDVWSLGCVLYAMAFGRSPFEFGPKGSFERLAVMNASLYFEGHTSGGLENTKWRNDEGSNIVETPSFVDLIRAMINADVATRISLKDAVYRASWKVGDPGEEFMIESEPSNQDVASPMSKPQPRDSWTADSLQQITTPLEGMGVGEQLEGDNKGEKHENESSFDVDWDIVDTETPTKSNKKKNKKKKKKKRIRKKGEQSISVEENEPSSVGVRYHRKEEKDTHVSSDSELDGDEFGEFASSPDHSMTTEIDNS